MTAISLGSASFWYSEDMEEQVVVLNGEFLLLNSNTRRVEKLGGTMDEAREALKTLGKFEEFPAFS
ncbi:MULTISPECIES: hypothetical protein [Sporomusa]|uniref:Uncharacterized protein n=2 Tax=Sporomusa TaxID=2375 RepID=A0ABP2C9T5_9FIRM|nr:MULTISPECIES: hypothetical protein [Sporomusa]MCM0760815.1 hypothetical protein [Sporomusa sphaeroides DSM 2875]OLS55214.1 hypothetical protein SPSPH_39550 [Sporomusa sphaeroides DSM 2875]CVK20448.1 hypothetical protein SSPH_03116 [Sporomusa sphaeroides DSM 2875]SCM78774.1 conserved hypothetical protein [uncultured Sporomusa sp.]HML32203.1 hypothetical protein [Sporomusa sphaeroides]